MMKRIKKMLWVLLLVCVAAFMVACDSGDEDNRDEEPTEVTPTSTPKVAVTIAEATPTPDPSADPTETPTPTADPTGSPELTETPTPTAEPTAVPTIVVDDAKYEKTTTPYEGDADPRRKSTITVSRVDTAEPEIVFDSAAFTEEHREEWIASYEQKLSDMSKRTKNALENGSIGRFDLFMTEKPEYTADFGTFGRVEVYSHTIGFADYMNYGVKCAYIVSCWLVNEDMSREYVVLYDSNMFENSDGMEKKLFCEVYYGNTGSDPDVFQPLTTRKTLTKVSYSEAPSLSSTEVGDEQLDYVRYYTISDMGYPLALLDWDSRIETTTEWPVQRDGWLSSSDQQKYYFFTAEPWEVNSYDLIEIDDSLESYRLGEPTEIADFESFWQDGVFRETVSVGNAYQIQSEVEIEDNYAKVRLFLLGQGMRELIMENRCQFYTTFETTDGEKLKVSGIDWEGPYYPAYHEDYLDSIDGPMTFRYYPAGANRPTVYFHSGHYSEANWDDFDRAFGSGPQSEFTGSIITNREIRETHSLGSFGDIYVVGINSTGNVPSDNHSISGAYFGVVWIGGGSKKAESFLTCCWGSNESPMNARDYLMFANELPMPVDEALWDNEGDRRTYEYLKKYAPKQFKSATPDLATIDNLTTTVTYGRVYEQGTTADDPARLETRRAVYDANNNLLLVIKDYRNTLDDRSQATAASITAIGASNALLSYTDEEGWTILSYSLDEIVDALAAEGAFSDRKSSGQKLAKDIKDHILTIKNDDGKKEYYFVEKTSINDRFDVYATVIPYGDGVLINYAIADGELVQAVESLEVTLK